MKMKLLSWPGTAERRSSHEHSLDSNDAAGVHTLHCWLHRTWTLFRDIRRIPSVAFHTGACGRECREDGAVSIAMLVMWIVMHGQTVNGDPVPAGCRLEHIVTAEGTAMNTALCGESPEWQRVEPLDLPAVQVERTIKAQWLWTAKSSAGYESVVDPEPCPAPGKTWKAEDGTKVCWIPTHTEPASVCRDKRRVLLTDESGKRHCILFGEGR